MFVGLQAIVCLSYYHATATCLTANRLSLSLLEEERLYDFAIICVSFLKDSAVGLLYAAD